MVLEPRRGCGYRQLNKLYLVGSGITIECHRLPLNIPEICPVCGSGVKFSRGWTWINPKELFGECKEKDVDESLQALSTTLFPCHKVECKICFPPVKVGLMFVGQEYTPQSFTIEAAQLGVSKAIGAIPKGLELGKTWVFLAHKKAGKRVITEESLSKNVVESPAVFYAFVPVRVEMLLKKSDATEDKLEILKKRNITPIIVDDDYEEKVAEAEEIYKSQEQEKKVKDEIEVLEI